MPPTLGTGRPLPTTTTRTTATLLFPSSHLPLREYVTLEEVLDAYYDCRKHKRRTSSALKFELTYEKGCYELWQELNNKTYEIGKSIAFCVTYPKLREVFAADFRDRTVHHLIINKFNDLLEAEMLDSTFACRKGKGTQYGVEYLQERMMEVGGDGWYAKCDIQGFFMSINREILLREIERILRKNNIEDIDWWLWLIEKVVKNRPEKNCERHGDVSLWDKLPKNKSLFHSNGVGLPIGNLTSQVFANVYMSMFDRWMKERLGEDGVMCRYVDDFIILHSKKKSVIEAAMASKIWLRENLKLTVHPKKKCIQQICKGVRFTGVYARLNCLLPSHRLIEGTKRLIESSPNIPAEKVVGRMNSRFGLMIHYKSYNLRRRMWRELSNKNKGKYLLINNKKIKQRRVSYETVC